MWCLRPIWLLPSSVCASEDHHNYILAFCDRSTKGILLPNEIDFKSTEGLNDHFLPRQSNRANDRPLRSSWFGVILMKNALWNLNIARLLKTAVTQHVETLKRLCPRNMTPHFHQWLRNHDLKTIFHGQTWLPLCLLHVLWQFWWVFLNIFTSTAR